MTYLPSTVIRQDDTVNAVLDGQECILGALNALQHDRKRGDTPEPLQVLPAETRIDEGGNRPCCACARGAAIKVNET